MVEIRMAEIRETHTIKEKGEGSGATPWLAFIVGALLIAVVTTTAIMLIGGRRRRAGNPPGH